MGTIPFWVMKLLMCQEFGKWPWEPVNVSAFEWLLWTERWAFLKKVMNLPKNSTEDQNG